MEIVEIKKLADQITAKRQELEGIENEVTRCNAALAATETAKRKLADLKAQRATLLADAFRASKKADTKQIDGDLATAAEAVRVEADKALAASGALAQLQSEAATVSEALTSLQREQRGLAAQHIGQQFNNAEAAFLSALEVLGAAYTDLHAAHAAHLQLTGHGSSEMREALRNYGSLRIFTPAPETMRGWAEPEWLAGPALERITATKAERVLEQVRGAGVPI